MKANNLAHPTLATPQTKEVQKIMMSLLEEQRKRIEIAKRPIWAAFFVIIELYKHICLQSPFYEVFYKQLSKWISVLDYFSTQEGI
ncbi:hypothetical protein [Paenibacillus agri]|uniref:Uncharacterized protein n=1 Tax=Paenibacillus agri TaxID=2744309 RepID=A0A850EJL9_9BACL|nr:hypothetical protein [Paenibacillus agri]NUU61563.1 hypothetical protein [Paenibacillus agri]